MSRVCWLASWIGFALLQVVLCQVALGTASLIQTLNWTLYPTLQFAKNDMGPTAAILILSDECPSVAWCAALVFQLPQLFLHLWWVERANALAWKGIALVAFVQLTCYLLALLISLGFMLQSCDMSRAQMQSIARGGSGHGLVVAPFESMRQFTCRGPIRFRKGQRASHWK